MRNSPYCNKFKLYETYIEDTITWIRYIHKRDIIVDTWCIQVCDNVQRKLCEVLNHTDTITPVKILRCSDKDIFWDEKDKYSRVLK